MEERRERERGSKREGSTVLAGSDQHPHKSVCQTVAVPNIRIENKYVNILCAFYTKKTANAESAFSLGDKIAYVLNVRFVTTMCQTRI